jgi:P27 family predicted phage terminase small subunit
MTIKEKIIKHLEDRGTYDPDVDDLMIDDLIENSQMARNCMRQLKEEGVVTSFHVGEVLVNKMNPLVNIYQMFLRNTNQIASKLGLNRSDRLRLKIIEKEKTSKFDEIMAS